MRELHKGGRLALRTTAPCNEYFTREFELLSLLGLGVLHTFSLVGRVAETWKGLVTTEDREWRHLSYFLDG